MTLETLLNCSADELEKLTEEELLKHFEPYLKITRPELAEKPEKSGKRSGGGVPAVMSKKQQANAILAAMGINVRV